MAIVNRDLDASEQKEVVLGKQQLATTGTTHLLWVAPYNFEVLKVNASARALSGAPTVRLDVYKFGGTNSISTMVAMSVPAYGVSGAITSASLAAAGSSFVQGAAGDALVATVAGTNTAANDLVVSVVIKKLQDIVSQF